MYSPDKSDLEVTHVLAVRVLMEPYAALPTPS